MTAITHTKDFINDVLVNKVSIFYPGVGSGLSKGETLHINGVSVTLKVTSELSDNQLGVYEITLAPYTIGARLHYHRFMDETFIVTQGTVTIEAGTDTHQAIAGTVVHVPRFTPHGFRNDTAAEIKLMLIFNPAQKREGFFRGLQQVLNEKPVDQEKYLKLYNKYDSFLVDEKE